MVDHGERIAKLEDNRAAMKDRVDALERDVSDLKLWRAWAIGAFASIAVVVGLFADRVKDILTGGN